MNKNEFLHTLCEKLKEGLTTSEIEEHVRYYSDYINQEISGGKSEVEVIEALGDPTLLARTILEVPKTERYSGAYQEEPSKNIYKEDVSQQQQQSAPFQISNVSGWGCIAIAIVAMMVIGLILGLFGIVFKAFMPVIGPILIILFIVAVIKQRR